MKTDSAATRTCRVCKTEKPNDAKAFPRNARAANGGLAGVCRECQSKINADRQQRRTAKAVASDPDYFRKRVQKYLWGLSRRRAKDKGLEHTISVDDIVVPDTCPILLVPLSAYRGGFDRSSYSLDRIDSSRGYVPGNVQVISWRANVIKSSLTIEEVRRLLTYMELGGRHT